MMKIDTAQVPGWEGIDVVLEFQHCKPAPDGSRITEARLVQWADAPTGTGFGWRQKGTGWKRTVHCASARCSPSDQFCRETGRRVAVSRLATSHHAILVRRLAKFALREYGLNRYALLRRRRRVAAERIANNA